MTDEEKEAINILKDREYDFDELYCTFKQSFIKPYDKSIEIVLNLIEKQQKEIEELNTKILSNAGIYQLGFKDGQKSVEDKIKAKIEELDKHITDIRNIARKSTDKVECRLLNDDINEYFKAKSVLQSLLEKE